MPNIYPQKQCTRSLHWSTWYTRCFLISFSNHHWCNPLYFGTFCVRLKNDYLLVSPQNCHCIISLCSYLDSDKFDWNWYNTVVHHQIHHLSPMDQVDDQFFHAPLSKPRSFASLLCQFLMVNRSLFLIYLINCPKFLLKISNFQKSISLTKIFPTNA